MVSWARVFRVLGALLGLACFLSSPIVVTARARTPVISSQNHGLCRVSCKFPLFSRGRRPHRYMCLLKLPSCTLWMTLRLPPRRPILLSATCFFISDYADGRWPSCRSVDIQIPLNPMETAASRRGRSWQAYQGFWSVRTSRGIFCSRAPRWP